MKSLKKALIILSLLSLVLPSWDQKKSGEWKRWLREVSPIMSEVERSIFNELPTEEESGEWKRWLREVSPIMSEVERSIFNELPTEEDRRRLDRVLSTSGLCGKKVRWN